MTFIYFLTGLAIMWTCYLIGDLLIPCAITAVCVLGAALIAYRLGENIWSLFGH